MRMEKKRFAGRTFNAVQVIPMIWRLKWFAVFAVPAAVGFYFYPALWENARGPEGQSLYYIVMIIPVLLALFALSRAAQRMVVYVDPQDKKFVVVKAGLVTSRERINTALSDITKVNAETRVVYDKAGDSGDSVRKTKTVVEIKYGKGVLKLWSYKKAATAQKAVRLIEQLLKS